MRLTLVDLFDAPLAPAEAADPDGTEDVPLPQVWLDAREASYRSELVDSLASASESATERADGGRPDAQLVFCIDTRSEIIRRHVEAAGDYETHGCAGFFGIPMRYDGYGSDVTVDACRRSSTHSTAPRTGPRGTTTDGPGTTAGTPPATRPGLR